MGLSYTWRIPMLKLWQKIHGYYVFELLLGIFLLSSLILSLLHWIDPGQQREFFFLVGAVGVAPVLWSAYRALRSREITVDFLAGIALIFALVGREWNSVIFVALMLSAARVLNYWNNERTKNNLEGLMKLRPELAMIKGSDGSLRKVSVESLQVGQIVLGSAGQRVPVDGVLMSGQATIDEASLTGESMPVEKNIGSQLYSSTLVVSGGFEMKANRVGRETTLERMIALVEQAHADKPAISTLAEKFGKWYILSIFAVTILLWIFFRDLNLLLAVALVVCADDVAIAIPLAYVSALGNAAKRGIVIKGGRYLETIGQASIFIFDKTGTITKGVLRVEQVIPLGPITKEQFLGYAKKLGEQSNHPVAKALARLSLEEGSFSSGIPENFQEISGKGLAGIFGDHHVLVGRRALMGERNISINDDLEEKIQRVEQGGQSVVLIAVNQDVVGLLGVADEIRPDIREVITELRNLGAKRIVMLTGDNDTVARRVATEVGIEEFYAGLLPEQKLERVSQLTEGDQVSVMVGDGVNDAAALERATVGVAMGAIGYDAAIDSANIVLMRDDLRRLPEVIRLAHSLRGIVKQNFWIWGVSNVVGLSLVFTGVIGPVGAAAYNFLSDFIPLFNSLKVVRMWFGRSN
jgi:heavy metal translocating P-type ATPase